MPRLVYRDSQTVRRHCPKAATFLTLLPDRSHGVQARVLRLVRLAKLLRIFRLSGFMAAIESSVSINYSVLDLVQFICIILLAAHWMACACLLFARVEVPRSQLCAHAG